MAESERDPRLATWYDYRNQAWVVDGVYLTCGHVGGMVCIVGGVAVSGGGPGGVERAVAPCYGKAHAGQRPGYQVEALYGPESVTAQVESRRVCENRMVEPRS